MRGLKADKSGVLWPRLLPVCDRARDFLGSLCRCPLETSTMISREVPRFRGALTALLASLLCAFLFAPNESHAQRIRVAVSMSDSATNGIFQSAFSAAFRSLGDIDVVSSLEAPTYVLEGVAMCSPRPCENANSYVLSLRFLSPFDSSEALATAAYLGIMMSSNGQKFDSDAAAHFLVDFLSGYEKSYMSWTAEWGRNRYEQAARELVRELDARCLEKKRMLIRTQRTNSKASWESYNSFVKGRDWLC